MSNSTQPVLFNEEMVQALEHLAELWNQKKSVEDWDQKASIWEKIKELQWKIAPILGPGIELIAKAGLFEVQATGIRADGEDEYFHVNDTYMLTDPDYLPTFALVTEKEPSFSPK
jgi:hypothetical protein